MKKQLAALTSIILLSTGCASVSFKTPTSEVRVVRFCWATESYKCSISTNGVASLEATKSSADAQTAGAIAEGVTKGIAAGIKP